MYKTSKMKHMIFDFNRVGDEPYKAIFKLRKYSINTNRE